MAVLLSNETWDDNKSYRVKQSDGTWKKKSWLTKAKSILFGDGTDETDNVEANLGAIKGITTSTSVTETGYAADASVISQLNSGLGDAVSVTFPFTVPENGFLRVCGHSGDYIYSYAYIRSELYGDRYITLMVDNSNNSGGSGFITTFSPVKKGDTLTLSEYTYNGGYTYFFFPFS